LLFRISARKGKQLNVFLGPGGIGIGLGGGFEGGRRGNGGFRGGFGGEGFRGGGFGGEGFRGGVNFNNNLRASFYTKQFLQIFCAYSFHFYFFGKRIFA